MVHTVAHNAQSVGVKRHICQKNKHFLVLIDSKILRGRKCHIGNQKPLNRRLVGGVHKTDNLVQGTGTLEFVLEKQIVVVGQAHTAKDNLIDVGTQSHHTHNLIVRLVGVGKERNLLPRNERVVQVDAGNARGD